MKGFDYCVFPLPFGFTIKTDNPVYYFTQIPGQNKTNKKQSHQSLSKLDTDKNHFIQLPIINLITNKSGIWRSGDHSGHSP
jgi:hypothetical protein